MPQFADGERTRISTLRPLMASPCAATLTSGSHPAVPDRQSFPEAEEETLKWWEENKTFEESVRLSEGRPRWSFYDGPPFATGLPHYGHLLAGTIKVPRHTIVPLPPAHIGMHVAALRHCTPAPTAIRRPLMTSR
jgi:hypothetical protein